MKRKIIKTADGSTTIHIVDWDEQYHSKHGAIQEAYHVFIDSGLSPLNKPAIAILEMGFGTGLNAFISFLEAERRQLHITYTGIEAFPISKEELEQLNYVDELKVSQHKHTFMNIHSCKWESLCEISTNFQLKKLLMPFKEFQELNAYDLIYFDAFGARVQPELWTVGMFRKMYNALNSEGVLVTYAAKGSVRRAMETVGFITERLPGPPGKREMLRATKPKQD